MIFEILNKDKNTMPPIMLYPAPIWSETRARYDTVVGAITDSRCDLKFLFKTVIFFKNIP